MPKKRPPEKPRNCVTCGKLLPVGIRYCVSCGTHDETDLATRVAGLDLQIEKSRQHTLMVRLLSRLSFGLWRF